MPTRKQLSRLRESHFEYTTRNNYRMENKLTTEEGNSTDIEAGNFLIAKFMGAKKTGTSTLADGGGYAYEYEVKLSDTVSFRFWDKPCWTNVRDLLYHKSWEWLMPALKKYGELPTNKEMLKHWNEIVDFGLATISTEITWTLFVKAIQDYNTQNKNNG